MSALGGLIKIFAEMFRKHSTSIAVGISATAFVSQAIQWGMSEARADGHRVGISLTWPNVPGMWEREGHGPWKDFYDSQGNKEHNGRDIIRQGEHFKTKETLSTQNLVSFNLKHPGTSGSNGSQGVCLSSIVFGFNKDVPTLGGITLVLDTAVMNYVFVNPHKAYDDKGIACIWWGFMDRGGDYLNFNAADLIDCRHSTNPEGLEKYIKCIQRAVIVSCTTNQGCHKFINVGAATNARAATRLLKPVKVAESYEDYMRNTNGTSINSGHRINFVHAN